MLIAGTLSGATRIITQKRYEPELQLTLIEKYKITFLFNTPLQLMFMMKNDRYDKTDLSTLKFVLSGGAPVPMHIKNAIQKRISANGNVHVGMAMTELACGVALDLPASERDTIGQLGDGNCVKVVDENGVRCGVNEDGELCIKTNCKLLGYYNNHQATTDAIDEEGFLKTGDIVHFDEDGFLHHVDRKKDLIKYLMFHISPAKIDAFLTESPDIKAACVVGIPDNLNELPAAVVVPTEGSSITEQYICDMVAGKKESLNILLKSISDHFWVFPMFRSFRRFL